MREQMLGEVYEVVVAIELDKRARIAGAPELLGRGQTTGEGVESPPVGRDDRIEDEGLVGEADTGRSERLEKLAGKPLLVDVLVPSPRTRANESEMNALTSVKGVEVPRYGNGW
jgi:hypothetical protein